MNRARPASVLASGIAVALLACGLAGPAWADDPSPTPDPTASVPASPSPSTPSAQPAEPPSASPSPAPSAAPSTSTPPTTSPSPSTSPSAPATSADGADDQVGAASVEAPLTLAVGSQGGPVAEAFFEDLGSFRFTGAAALADGSTVTVERRTGSAWSRVATAKVADGTYTASARVQGRGVADFRSSADGTEGASLRSSGVTVTVRDSTVSVRAAAKVNALKALAVRGVVVPARAGVQVRIDVGTGSTWKRVATATTGADGSYAASVGYGESRLKRYRMRASFRAVNRPRWERTPQTTFARTAVLDAKVAQTTRADVAKTYRNGCPTGPSRLTTIQLNYYGRDKRMHRGVIIIRSDLRQELVRAFGAALRHRYPVDKMRNPDAYGGNDPRQMRANNTSGFNCRKVVGNPYKMSPHSYGIAIDVNTVQNPYRDDNGKWWPSNAGKYRDRSPLAWGMLGSGSSLTKQLRKDHFFWGGLWNPGRDYQHFEYRG